MTKNPFLTAADVKRAEQIGLDLGQVSGGTQVSFSEDYDSHIVTEADKKAARNQGGHISVVELYDGDDEQALILGEPRAYHPHCLD